MPQGAGSKALVGLVVAVAKVQKTIPQIRVTIKKNSVLRSLPGTSTKEALYCAVAKARASATQADSVAQS